MRPLKFGDLVVLPDGMYGIVGNCPEGDAEVAVTLANGTEQMVAARPLATIPLYPGADEPANFAEWIVPTNLPLTRALDAFMGHGTARGEAAEAAAVIALWLALVPRVLALPAAEFAECTQFECDLVRAVLMVPRSPRPD